MTSPSRLTLYSWSTMLPRALRSSPPRCRYRCGGDSDERLVDGGQCPAVTFDLHRVARGELPVLDRRHLVAVTVLQDEGVTDPQCLAVDLVNAIALVVLDPGVILIDASFSCVWKRRPTGPSSRCRRSPMSSLLSCRVPRPYPVVCDGTSPETDEVRFLPCTSSPPRDFAPHTRSCVREAAIGVGSMNEPMIRRAAKIRVGFVSGSGSRSSGQTGGFTASVRGKPESDLRALATSWPLFLHFVDAAWLSHAIARSGNKSGAGAEACAGAQAVRCR